MSRRYFYDPSRPFGQRFVEVPVDWRPVPRKRLQIIGDSMPPIRSMADGRMYDSKSAYYADVKARGYEIVGNDLRPSDFAPAPFEPQGIKHDILEAASELGTPLA